ncbi:LacI family DNA-binding transcriptional regulator [Paenibacillus sp. GD4]|uniref:LacI family DNA-binding transcriptional regulator n=1 Tax=Paenibacillus sp. GD4 TaxID=3068890 RepID=UPI0027967660|nr:LacI family DNA-binding transcriptional regulator [Paenibacillus sp. GD4]MDQ1913671.1 LacI family DNA-binding transcriptional regulator [Paenibacillus sp. GD4]
MARKKSVTLPMLAEKLGLSVYTVSKALRGLPGMSETTRKEVIQLAKELGYLTKDQERSLLYEGIPRLSIQQRRFLLVTSSHYSYTIQQLFIGLKERMLELGHKVDIVFMPQSLSPEGFEDWAEQEGIVYSDGLFIAPLIPEPLEALLLELKHPRVLINFPPLGAKVDSIIWDIHEATIQSVHHLIANGHRNIMYVGDTTKTRGYKHRWDAFQLTMKQAGIEVEESSHFIGLSTIDPKWIATFQSHLERNNPTALICSSQSTNLSWLFYACSEAGLKIPGDMSIILIDYLQASIVPDITRPVLFMQETGYRAADRMLWRIANTQMPYEHIRVQGTFYNGSTVRNL